MLRSYVGRAAAVAAIFASCLRATLSREKSVQSVKTALIAGIPAGPESLLQFVKPQCTKSRRL